MKRGSALLIVLGMVSFMVISAVAFAAYMRYSRLPSSYLRRTSSSRHLVKAALAEAIDRIDVAIGNDPCPGRGNDGALYAYPRTSTDDESAYSARRNYWRSHCFIGTNRLVSADETVSTLCLEALAYLPPDLVNEARYYSRHSAAARWHTLGYDTGRYAYFAVDVSDHLDVNRIAANVGRNSSDSGRVSLAHVFENASHSGDGTAKPSAWDLFMDKFVDAADAYRYGGRLEPSNTKLPLVSLADLNLAIGNGDSAYGCPAAVVSPFCRYVATKGSSDFVIDASGEDGERLRTMAFVTDSYLPKAATASGADADYDLNDPQCQPFQATDLRQTASSVMTALNYSSQGKTRLLESLCGLGLAALWDYLDEDNVPLSLAVPTTERVPMFVALQPQLGNSQLEVAMTKGTVESDVPESDTKTLQRTAKRTDLYKIDPTKFTGGLLGGKVNTLVAFPFRRDDELNESFTVGGRLALFFSDTAMKAHTGNANDVLHLGRNKDLKEAQVSGGVFYAPLQEQSVRFTNVKTEDNAVREVPLSIGQSSAQTFASWLQANPMFKVTTQWTQTRTKDETTGTLGPWLPDEPDTAADKKLVDPTECYVPPLTAAGVVDDKYAIAANFKSLVESGDGKTVKLQMCVWLYAKNGDGKYVDLVPACMKDDDDLNSCANYQLMGPDANRIGGTPYPLMRFGGLQFDYKPKDLSVTAQDFGFGTAAVMCADPRWNWAPEHWFTMSGGFSAQGWLAGCQRGAGDRDRDIFMATSDAGYLQSVYELASLPRLTDLTSSGDNKIRGNMASIEGSGSDGFAENFDGTANSAFAWRTYRPFAVNGTARDDFEGVGFTSEGTGFRVNPFSSSDDILMAALANTPYNWVFASTNTTSARIRKAITEDDRKAETFNKNYCFNAMATDETAKFEWKDLKQIATAFRTKVRARSDGDWQAAFDELDWAGDAMGAGDNWAGATLSGNTCDLSDADKKFLYGFWKDSFAAKQQLFLVFVRAEPAMMGGGAIGQTPPQLGARAVALVWRDPTKTTADVGGQPRPHRTRILFYRQFD